MISSPLRIGISTIRLPRPLTGSAQRGAGAGEGCRYRCSREAGFSCRLVTTCDFGVVESIEVYTAMPYNHSMFEFIETPFFTKAVERYLDDDEYAELQATLNRNPESGVVVSGSGGRAQAAMGCQGQRQAWRIAHNLFSTPGPRPRLDAHGVWEERAGKHSRAHIAGDQGDYRKCAR